MDFWEVIRTRRSVREFAAGDVPDEVLDKAIKAAALAPCGSQVRNWRFIVVRDKDMKVRMREAVDSRMEDLAGKMKSSRARKDFLAYGKYFTFFSEAPVVVAVIMKKYDSLSARILKRYEDNTDYMSTAGIQNVAAAIENMLLALVAQGLGACWMTGPMIAKEGLEKVLSAGEEEDLLALVPVGEPKKSPPPNALPGSVDDIIERL